MYLARLYIKNYRSIKELDLQFDKGKNVLIGRNNSGKSNIIKALDIVLGETSPTWGRSQNITEDDFYSRKKEENGEVKIYPAEEIIICCELLRDEGEQLNYDELYKCYGFYILAQEKYGPARRMPEKDFPSNASVIFEIDEDKVYKTYVNPKLRNQMTFEQEFDDKYHFAYAFHAIKDEEGNISKDMRFLYRENEESDWVLAFRASVRNQLLQSAIIPSFRDPQNQLRLAHYTWYGKLMKYLTAEHEKSEDLQDAFAKVKEIADGIFKHIREDISKSSLDVLFPDTILEFQFTTEKKDLYKSCSIYVDDGFKSPLIEKGSGIQSAVIIGLFSYYTQHVNTVTSALLCIEEPEIYLHPHGRRVIGNRLDDFLGNNKNQVILSTHSVEFIKPTSGSLNLILVRKDKEGTKCAPIHLRQFNKLLIDDNQNELFFADKVIVCEGYDNYLVRYIAQELFPKRLDEQNVSIISVGGKDRISGLVKLILQLGIKCFILADFDYLLRDKSDDRKKYDTEKDKVKAHESIASLGKEFFMQFCILGEGGEEVFGKLQSLRTKLKQKFEKQFYTAKSVEEFANDELCGILESLRKKGVCILSREIEGFCTDSNFLAPKEKLSLDKIYELSERLGLEGKITDIFDCDEIRVFLEAVFDR